MRKILRLCVLVVLAYAIIPFNANAASYTIFASKNTNMDETTLDGTFKLEYKQGSPTQFYIGMEVTQGTQGTYDATVELKNSNFKFKSSSILDTSWKGAITASEDKSTIEIHLTNATGFTGKKVIAAITLDVTSDEPSDTCEVVMQRIQEKEPEPTPTNPKCKETTENGVKVYYDANGNKVTEEAYKKSCEVEESPQTGSFLPYTLIIAGIAGAAI